MVWLNLDCKYIQCSHHTMCGTSPRDPSLGTWKRYERTYPPPRGGGGLKLYLCNICHTLSIYDASAAVFSYLVVSVSILLCVTFCFFSWQIWSTLTKHFEMLRSGPKHKRFFVTKITSACCISKFRLLQGIFMFVESWFESNFVDYGWKPFDMLRFRPKFNRS